MHTINCVCKLIDSRSAQAFLNEHLRFGSASATAAGSGAAIGSGSGSATGSGSGSGSGIGSLFANA